MMKIRIVIITMRLIVSAGVIKNIIIMQLLMRMELIMAVG